MIIKKQKKLWYSYHVPQLFYVIFLLFEGLFARALASLDNQ